MTQTVNLGTDLAFSVPQNIFNGIYTQFAVTKSGNPAPLSDYTVTNGKITFSILGTYTVIMTNTAIISHPNGPAEVKFNVIVNLPTYTVTLPTVTGATVVPTGGSTSPVNHGGSYSFTVTLDATYNQSNIIVKTNDTPIIPVSGIYTISNITANQIITIEGLQINTHTITATAGANGTIDPSGAISVTQGANQTFTATPNSCYEIDHWKLNDSIVQTGGNTYTFSNVQENATVEVTFKAITYETPIEISICEGNNYDFFGEILTESGAYSHTLYSVHGCDSVIELTLTVNPIYNIPTTAAICQGNDYDFFGQILTTAGDYSHTLTTIHGCDSVIALTLTVNNVFNVPIVLSICEGESYDFYGTLLTEAGTYYHTLTTIHGCDSTIALTLTVNPTYNIPTTASICQGGSYNFYEQTLTMAGTYYHTLTTVHGCDSTIALTLTVNPTYNIPTTASICQGGSYNFYEQTLTTAGDYSHTLTTIHGCDSVIELTLTVNPIYTIPTTASICQGGSYNFYGQTLTTTGTYYHTLTTVHGCDSILELTLIVNPIYTTQITASIYDCEWYDFFGQPLNTEGIYYDTLPTVHGCDSIFELTLTVNPFYPVEDIIDVPTTATVNVQLTLTGTVVPSNATYQNIVWSINDAGTTNASIYNGNEFFATTEGIAVVKATIENGTCIGDFEKHFYITVSNVGVEELPITNYELQIYPNPTTNDLFIKTDLQIEKVELYSTLGSLLISENNFKEKISIAALPKGVYFLKVHTDKGVVVRKVVKE